MAYTIQDDTDTTDLGFTQTDGSDEGNGLTPITLPESTSAGALLVPTTGPSLRISLNMVKTGNISTLQTFILKARKWIADGGSLAKANLTYSSDLDTTILSVRAVRFNKSWVAGKPRILNYTLDLLQGTFI